MKNLTTFPGGFIVRLLDDEDHAPLDTALFDIMAVVFHDANFYVTNTEDKHKFFLRTENGIPSRPYDTINELFLTELQDRITKIEEQARSMEQEQIAFGARLLGRAFLEPLTELLKGGPMGQSSQRP